MKALIKQDGHNVVLTCTPVGADFSDRYTCVYYVSAGQVINKTTGATVCERLKATGAPLRCTDATLLATLRKHYKASRARDVAEFNATGNY